jgi:hypothetical protein
VCQELTTSDERVGGSPISRPKGGGVPFLDRKKEKLEDNNEKKSILTTFGSSKAQKTHLNHPYRAVIRDFRRFLAFFGCLKRFFHKG